MRERLLTWAAWIAACGVSLATALGLLGRLGLEGRIGWVFDLASHWPKHLFLAAFAVALGAGVLKLWRPAGLASAAAALNAALVLGVGNFATPEAAPSGAVLVKVVSANIHREPYALNKVIEMAREYGADVVSIYEAPEDLTDEGLAKLFPEMPLRAMPTWTPMGFRLVKRSLIVARTGTPEQVGVTPFEYSNGVILRLPFRAGSQDVQIVATHPPSPGMPNQMFDRDRQLRGLADGLVQDRPFIVMGDFNTTPWGHVFSVVPGMRAGDPRFDGSFPADMGLLGLPIDHIMFGGGLVLTEYHVGPDIGSDHRPLFATFALPAR